MVTTNHGLGWALQLPPGIAQNKQDMARPWKEYTGQSTIDQELYQEWDNWNVQGDLPQRQKKVGEWGPRQGWETIDLCIPPCKQCTRWNVPNNVHRPDWYFPCLLITQNRICHCFDINGVDFHVGGSNQELLTGGDGKSIPIPGRQANGKPHITKIAHSGQEMLPRILGSNPEEIVQSHTSVLEGWYISHTQNYWEYSWLRACDKQTIPLKQYWPTFHDWRS